MAFTAKTNWQFGDTVTETDLNRIEQGIKTLDLDKAGYTDLNSAIAQKSIDGAVRTATTANITLSGLQTIDGVVLVVGDRVLVKNQTTGSQNGIYVVDSAVWARATDSDSTAKILGGISVYVREGTNNGGKGFTMSNAGTITLGTTALIFVQLMGAGADTTKAPLASPALTGTPTAPTPAAGDNSTKIPTTAWVNNNSLVATTASITLYVDAVNGNDGNTGLAAGAGNALQSISAALAKVPKILKHTVTINVAAGTYPGLVNIDGFMSGGFNGYLNIIGDSNNTTRSRIISGQINIRGCLVEISVSGLTLTYPSSTPINILGCSRVVLTDIVVDTIASLLGILIDKSIALLITCVISNRLVAIQAQANSSVMAVGCSGTGNTTGMYASSSNIVFSSGRPTGTTNASQNSGGSIIDTSIAPTASPAFTGSPTAPTPSLGNNSSALATTNWVNLNSLVTTTGLMMLYVDAVNGNDANTGLSAGAGNALATIQAALDKVPKILKHNVSIIVAAGTYNPASTLNIDGFLDGGNTTNVTLSIHGDPDNTTRSRIIANTINIRGCSAHIYFSGFTNSVNNSLNVYDCTTPPILNNYVAVAVSASAGINCVRSKLYLNNCVLSNRTLGILADMLSQVFMSGCSGTGNTTAINAQNGATVVTGPGGALPAGALVTSNGGSIVDAIAPLGSPIFTGNPKAPTPTAGDNSTNIPTTAWINQNSLVATTSGITLYVDSVNGNDSNTGLSAGAGNALATINGALAKIPKLLKHNIFINVAPGTYPSCTIDGFIGLSSAGMITINGDTDNTTRSRNVSGQLNIRGCSASININGITSTYAASTALFIGDCTGRIIMTNFVNVSSSASLGCFVSKSTVEFSTCVISNRGSAILGQDTSFVLANACTGTSNTNAFFASMGAVILFSNGKPSGALQQDTGGSIVDTAIASLNSPAFTGMPSFTASGTAPFSVVSPTIVPNLNADMVGGYHETDFMRKIAGLTDYLITTTGLSNYLGHTPATSGAFLLYVYARVKTAATTLYLDCQYIDESGTAKTKVIQASTSLAVGGYTYAPVYVEVMATTGNIYLGINAATANQVHITASLIRV
ncbi:hypothetical protein [Cohnella silvisoli]|uniref:Tail fiber protein n=1 Tax=Cohnella silvisoli TaxID=2873699 RepID=A0ABV1L3A8_9BACL|nr:hypothetical protein [Cohnella silvisoli]MCD9026060.1 hypothetical protein [Cohnella silvisoli]